MIVATTAQNSTPGRVGASVWAAF